MEVALIKYIRYIKAKGDTWRQIGNVTEESFSDGRKVTEIIFEEIKKGTRYSKLCSIYPGQINNITKLMKFRPPRTCRTDVLYFYGPSGIGKTTTMIRVLQAIQSVNSKIDYYCKLGGLDRWWDSYDNQPIVLIDDPVGMDAAMNKEPIQRLKNVMSHGDTFVEVKGGSMVFDSSLIIIISNQDPRTLAQTCGLDNFEAIFRRFTDSCGAHYVKTRKDCLEKMTEYTMLCIKKNMNCWKDLDFDISKAMHNIKNFIAPTYDVDFTTCNAMKYFK